MTTKALKKRDLAATQTAGLAPSQKKPKRKAQPARPESEPESETEEPSPPEEDEAAHDNCDGQDASGGDEEGGDAEDAAGQDGQALANPKHAWMTAEQREEKKRKQREEQRRLKDERKGAKPGQSLLQEARPLWDVARRLDTPAEARAEALAGLFRLLSGKFAELILKHDGSRVVQTCVKHGSPQERQQIAAELKGAFFEVAKNKYGKHLVGKLLLYCPKQRDAIIGEFRGKAVKAMHHRDAAGVLETIFSDYSNAAGRQRIVQEFYGPEYGLFKKEPVPLERIVAGSPDKKAAIAARLEGELNVLLKKGNLGLSLVHRLLLDYLAVADMKTIQAWIPTVADFLPEIVHTADGAKAVIRMVAWATTKDRKAIIKSFKPFVEKTAMDDRGFQALLAIFALVDDTVLVGKGFVGELCGAVGSLLADKHGRRVIGYLVTGKNPRLIPTTTIRLLEEARKLAESTSKKDDSTRLAELKAYLLPSLLGYIKANVGSLLGDNEMALFLSEVVGHIDANDQVECLEAAFQLIDEARWFAAGPPAEFLKKAIKSVDQPAAQLILDKVLALRSSIAETEAPYMLMHLLRFEALVPTIRGLVPKLKKMKPSSRSVELLLSKIQP